MLNWSNIDGTEKDAIVNFLLARKGSEPFTFTIDGETFTLKCKSVSRTKTTANAYDVSASCEKVFDQ